MTKRTRRYRKRGGGQVPPLQTYGYENGASSPQQNAMLQQKQAAEEQNALNNQHGAGKRRRTRRRRRLRGGYQYKQLGGRIVVPQSDNAPPAAGPVDGNSLAVGGAENFSQTKENASYDDVNGKPKVTTVAGGGRRKRKRKRKTKKHGKTRGKYGYNQRGCSKNGKRKSRRRTKRRKSKRFITGGRRRRTNGKGGYVAQLWGCFS